METSQKSADTKNQRFGVGVHHVVELSDSTAAERKFKFRFSAKGFNFPADAIKAGVGLKINYPWNTPRAVRVDNEHDKEGIEAQVAAKLTEAIGEFDING